jgi:FSR family fosmidomycin resistance protein-like MFS transporter
MTPREMGGSATSLMFGSQSALSIGMPIVGGMLADSHGLTSVFYLLAGVMLASNLVAIMLPKDRAAPAETK